MEPLPLGLLHVWRWFLDLHAARGTGIGMGPAPIGWSDIWAWRELTRARPSPPEIDLIRRLDREWMAAQGEGANVD